uniref:Uncharacterized protein n=1 Tax=Rousettus aegyptiacus TaxID=9407 RepID=A0A7J8H129_ROUAE|nr:hypothetical protein HJG63_011252 [Rousettus aegyptiacus]
MGAGRGPRRKKPHHCSQCAHSLWALPHLPFQTRILRQGVSQVPSTSSGTRMLFPVPNLPSGITYGHTLGFLLCPALLTALLLIPTSSQLPQPPSASHFFGPTFSLLIPEGQVGHKVLNATRVSRESPPATMMPSRGTSTQVARGPADGQGPGSEMPQVLLYPLCLRELEQSFISLTQRATNLPISVL